MTGHLPECPWPSNGCSHTPMQDREPLFCMDCLTECICDRLAAYYYRVIFTQESTWRAKRQLERSVGYKRGLDAARDAVEALGINEDHHRWRGGDPEYALGVSAMREWALAAIDALRGESE